VGIVALNRTDWRAAARRWQSCASAHDRTREQLARGEKPDTPERQAAAARHERNVMPMVAALAGAAKITDLTRWLGTRGAERLIGKSDFEPGAFLEVGLAVGRAVCMIEVRDRLGATVSRGTGFLVAPGLVLTNHHVIMDEREAANALATFDYRNDPYGRAMPTTVFTLNPAAFWLTDKELDCSFCALGERSSGAFVAEDFGWLPLVGVEGKLEVGDPINIIQHPRGEPMQWVLRSNNLLLLPELDGYRDRKTYAHYEADTMPGSSGAPALTRLWEVFALHHQAVPAINEHGEILDVDGNPYRGTDESRVKWLGNEGIRVSALVRFLASSRSRFSGSQRETLEAVLSAERPDYIALALRARGGTTASHGAPGGSIGGINMAGKIEFTLPLRITISMPEFGASASALPASDPRAAREPDVPGGRTSEPGRQEDPADTPPLSPSLQKERAEALQLFERSRTKEYYAAAADAVARDRYYESTRIAADRAENFRTLSRLLSSTHRGKPRYAPARHVYPWVDLYKQGRRLVIRSIYSGQVFDPAEFIDEAFRIEARRERLRVSLRMNEALSNVPDALMEELLENSAPYNCEHVVPQSWFGKKEPMRGDLHHLFACESRCNSFRGNHAYFEFPPTEAFMEMCGQRENDRFEPSSGKGPVARATFYYLARYPRSIDLDESLMDEGRIRMLLSWHASDPVSDYERHRNAAIFEVQGNRNPFIDHPEWAERVDLTLGLT
jgi:endonuclease I/V8-like Glu-specific endopeptidase